LRKLGFLPIQKNDSVFGWYVDEYTPYFYIDLKDFEFSIAFEGEINLGVKNYVHEIQNVFYCTIGRELTLTS